MTTVQCSGQEMLSLLPYSFYKVCAVSKQKLSVIWLVSLAEEMCTTSTLVSDPTNIAVVQ